MTQLTHLDEAGRPRMVDVSDKAETAREATAAGEIRMRPETLALIQRGGVPKGDVLSVAHLAGVMAAKRTWELVPLCHPLPISGVWLSFAFDEQRSLIEVSATVRVTARTGVEMEALTAVSVAALAIYDMCKAVDRDMEITNIRLLHKVGGKSGEYRRSAQECASGS